VPTVLYCWQYYDVIASVKTPTTTTVWNRLFAWIRGLLVLSLCLSTVVFWIIYAYSTEAAIYYGTLSKHYNIVKQRHAHRWTMRSVTALEIVNISECLLSVGFLIGIIWQCHQIAKATQASGQDQLLSFKRVDYLFVLMHCVLLLSQTGTTAVYSYVLKQANTLTNVLNSEHWITLSYITEGIDIFVGSVLDIIICILLCRIVHDCQRLDSPLKGRLVSSDSEDDPITKDSLDETSNLICESSYYQDLKQSIFVPNASIASTS
jgi:hypothetical protein